MIPPYTLTQQATVELYGTMATHHRATLSSPIHTTQQTTVKLCGKMTHHHWTTLWSPIHTYTTNHNRAMWGSVVILPPSSPLLALTPRAPAFCTNPSYLDYQWGKPTRCATLPHLYPGGSSSLQSAHKNIRQQLPLYFNLPFLCLYLFFLGGAG